MDLGSKNAIGLFTGTFDPIHLGHLGLAKSAGQAFSLKQVWLLVNPDPRHKTVVTAYQDRLAMAKLAVANESRIEVVDWSGLHTVAGLTEFMDGYPGERFVFVVGMDVMAQLDSWEGHGFIVENASFAVARREGADKNTLADLRVRLGEQGSRLSAKEFDFNEYKNVSSGLVRAAVYSGQTPLKFVDPRVYEYILRQRLYLPMS